MAEINFTDRNAVEKFLEGKKFRRCENLKCSPVELQYQILYMPMCMEGRFNREGFVEHLEMPRPPRPLSPMIYTTIPMWAPLVSCPVDCKGYQNRTVAKVKKTIASSAQTLLRRNKAESANEPKKGFWETGLGQFVMLVVTGVIVGLIIWRVTVHYEKPTSTVHIETSGDESPVVQGNQGSVSVDNSTSEQPKKPQNAKSNKAEGHK